MNELHRHTKNVTHIGRYQKCHPYRTVKNIKIGVKGVTKMVKTLPKMSPIIILNNKKKI